jgi:PAS domain S-box-containing protein
MVIEHPTEDAFRLLVDSVKDYAIFLLDPAGIIRSWNAGARRLKGYTAEEIIGQHFSVFYSQADRHRCYPQYELEVAEREGRYEDEGWRVRKDGTCFWANVVITRLTGADGALVGFGKVTRDLTERRLAEEQLRQANETLEKKVEERARDEFLSIASHELRTPLTPLKLQLQGLILHLNSGTIGKLEPERLKAMADTLDRSLTRLSHLVDNLLDVGRINAGKIRLQLESVDAAELVRDTCSRFQNEARKHGSELRAEGDVEVPGFLDRLRVEQVLSNLALNAIRYGKGPVGLSAQSQDDRIVFRVQDHGPGIPQADIPRIFNRFEQLSNAASASGLGLGLYISKQIVDAHHGTIRVESEPGHGATFWVELPARAQ